MTNCNFVNLVSVAALLRSKSNEITLPPLASGLLKREAKSTSLALLKAKDNPVADGKS
jgi:hypothetical protein